MKMLEGQKSSPNLYFTSDQGMAVPDKQIAMGNIGCGEINGKLLK